MLSRRRFLQIAAASTGLAITGTDLLSQAVANASTTIRPDGSRGIRHIVILMMENRSFDHFLGWLPGADGRHDLTFVSAVDGNTYPNYPLAPDFQGCGYSDPDHSWEGWLVQHNYGKLDGFLQRPTTPAGQPGRDPRRGEHVPDRLLHQPQPRRNAARPCPTCRSSARWPSSTRRWTATSARSPARPSRTASTSTRARPTGTTTPRRRPRCRPSGTSSPRSPTPTASPPAATTTATRPFLALWASPGDRAGGDLQVPGVLPPLRRRRRLHRRALGRHVVRRGLRERHAAERLLHRPRLRQRGDRDLAATTTRWATSGSASASSPTPTTRWPTTATSTTRSSS